MNAHNEQLLISSLQAAATGNTTTLKMMELCGAAAKALSSNPTNQPAAAQEAVAWQRRYIGPMAEWRTITKAKFVDTKTGKWANLYEVRELYAAPVTAAPVGVTRAVADEAPFGLNATERAAWARGFNDALEAASIPAAPADTWFADQLTAMGEVIPLDSTPAAPGIDLSEVPRYTLAHGDFPSEMLEHSQGAWVRLGDVESALIDASPNAGSEARAAVLAELVEAISAFKGKRGAFMALGAQDERTVRLWWALANAQASDAEVRTTSGEVGR